MSNVKRCCCTNSINRFPAVPMICLSCPEKEVINNCTRISAFNDEWKQRINGLFRSKRNKHRRRRRCKARSSGWYDKNSKLIEALSKYLQRSQECVQYLLMQLVFTNFGKLLHLNGPMGMRYYIPLTGCLDNELRNVFDNYGNFRMPLDPNNVQRLLLVLREYILHKFDNYLWTDDYYGVMSELQLQTLLSKIQHSGLLDFLGDNDELVSILSRINKELQCVFDLEAILRAILTVNLEHLTQKSRKKRIKNKNSIKSIERLYAKIAQGTTKATNNQHFVNTSESLSMSSHITSRDSIYSNTSALLRFEKSFHELNRKSVAKTKTSRQTIFEYVEPPTPDPIPPPKYIWFKEYPSRFVDAPLKPKYYDEKRRNYENRPELGYGYSDVKEQNAKNYRRRWHERK